MKTTVKIEYSNCTMREALDHFYSVYKKVGNDENSSFSLTIEQVIPTKKEEEFIKNKQNRKRLHTFKEKPLEGELANYPLDTEEYLPKESFAKEQRTTGMELLTNAINLENTNGTLSE